MSRKRRRVIRKGTENNEQALPLARTWGWGGFRKILMKRKLQSSGGSSSYFDLD